LTVVDAADVDSPAPVVVAVDSAAVRANVCVLEEIVAAD
jgi:hypothetical protein